MLVLQALLLKGCVEATLSAKGLAQGQGRQQANVVRHDNLRIHTQLTGSTASWVCSTKNRMLVGAWIGLSWDTTFAAAAWLSWVTQDIGTEIDKPLFVVTVSSAQVIPLVTPSGDGNSCLKQHFSWGWEQQNCRVSRQLAAGALFTSLALMLAVELSWDTTFTMDLLQIDWSADAVEFVQRRTRCWLSAYGNVVRNDICSHVTKAEMVSRRCSVVIPRKQKHCFRVWAVVLFWLYQANQMICRVSRHFNYTCGVFAAVISDVVVTSV